MTIGWENWAFYSAIDGTEINSGYWGTVSMAKQHAIELAERLQVEIEYVSDSGETHYIKLVDAK